MGARKQRRSGLTRREVLQVTVLGVAGLSLAGPTKPAGAAPALLKGKQDLVVGIGTDVVMMDTRITQPTPAKSQILHLMDPLIYPDNSGKPAGILLSAWEPVLDPPGWRLKLRPAIRFTNGEPLNALSIKYSIDSILDDNNKSWVHSDPRSQFNLVKEVRVEDELTALVLTKTFFRALPNRFYQYLMVPPKDGAEKGKEFGVNPVGTGHYKFVEYRSGSHLRLESNTAYPGHWEGPARNDSVTFRYLAENATRVAALEAGEVHIIDNLPPDAVGRLKRNPNLDVSFSSATCRINGMNFHAGRPPFDNLKARLAVMHALNREALAKKVMGGMAEVVNAPFPPGTLGTVGETFRPYEFDPRKAKQYFAEAGLTAGTKIKVGGPVGRYINDKQIVTAVAGMIAEIGFDPQIEQLGFGTYWPKVTQGYYDLFYAGWNTLAYDPVDSQVVYLGWSSDNAGATHFVEHNKRVAELYKQLNTVPSRQEAERYARELAHLLWENIPIAYLFCEPNIAGLSKKVKGWKPRRDTYIFLWGAHLE